MTFLSAKEIVAGVQRGTLSPVDVLLDALDRYYEQEPVIGAFRELLREEALEQAEALAKRKDLKKLPLAGVPIAIKDSIAVKGVALRNGSAATSETPSEEDHPVTARLRAAGAVIVGVTAVPEFCVWGTTDSVYGRTRNPWNPEYSPGGSSGGSAAAVAAGVVPLAHGTDGMGSVRIPAANTGLFGIKPGSGTVQQPHSEWLGMSENGPLATSVDDAALMLSVMAEKPELAEITVPEMPLRIGLALKPPTFLSKLSAESREATLEVAEALRSAGHRVEEVSFPYRENTVALLARWTGGVAESTEGVDRKKLEGRVRFHARIGRLLKKLGAVKDKDRQLQENAAEGFFKEYDLLLTPTLTQTVPQAKLWHKKGWLANMVSNIRYAPYPSLWNFLGWPAAAIPSGLHPELDLPLSVQLVAPPGGEKLILQTAKLVEQLKPWPLTASS